MPLTLLGGHGDADAGAADEDAPVAPAGDDGLAGRVCNIGIIAGFPGQGAKILIGDLFGVQVLFDFFLEGVAAVVAADGQHIHQPF